MFCMLSRQTGLRILHVYTQECKHPFWHSRIHLLQPNIKQPPMPMT